jgi:putative endopeptidase
LQRLVQAQSAARRPDSYGRFTELAELNRLHLKQILEDASAPVATRTANEQKIGDEYASCMDTAAVNKLGLAPLSRSWTALPR